MIRDNDAIDGCDALARLPRERRVNDDDVVLLVLTAGVEDRDDIDAIEYRLAEYEELFDVRP